MNFFELMEKRHKTAAKMWSAANKQKAKIQAGTKKILNFLKSDPSYLFRAKTYDYETEAEVYRLVLTKSGAEFLCSTFQIETEYDLSLEKSNGDTIYNAKCSLKQDGLVIGQGSSAQSSMRYSSYNMALKMAEESALVAAVIRVFNLSGVLSQDLEESREKLSRKDFLAQEKAEQKLDAFPHISVKR